MPRAKRDGNSSATFNVKDGKLSAYFFVNTEHSVEL